MIRQEFDRKTVSKTGRTERKVKDSRLTSIDNPKDLQVLGVLNERGSLTRGDLVRITGIPRSTLYDSLTRLQLLGLVNRFVKKAKRGPGRPLVMFESVFNTGE